MYGQQLGWWKCISDDSDIHELVFLSFSYFFSSKGSYVSDINNSDNVNSEGHNKQLENWKRTTVEMNYLLALNVAMILCEEPSDTLYQVIESSFCP